MDAGCRSPIIFPSTAPRRRCDGGRRRDIAQEPVVVGSPRSARERPHVTAILHMTALPTNEA